MAEMNHGLHFETQNMFSLFGRGGYWTVKLDKDNPCWKHIELMAKEAHNPHPDYSTMMASTFVIRLLFNSKKPMSENLILKRLREREITFYQPNISTLMIRLLLLKVVKTVPGRGYAISSEMQGVIEEFKPTI